MRKSNKSVKKGRKRAQKGGEGMWNNFKKMVGLSNEEEAIPSSSSQVSQSPGGVSGFMGNVTQNAENLLGNAESFIGNTTSQISNSVTSGVDNLRAKGAALIAPSSEPNVAAKGQEQLVTTQNAPVTTQNAPVTTQNAPVAAQDAAVGGRRKKSLKGGSNIASSAAPVHGLNVAKPTYWINGGRKRSQKKSKKSKKSRKIQHKKR
jgi:hypothetical protein